MKEEKNAQKKEIERIPVSLIFPIIKTLVSYNQKRGESGRKAR